MLVERQLSATDRSVTPEAIGRLGDVILRKLRSDDAILRQGYARRFIDRVVVAPGTITISGPIKPLEIAIGADPEHQAPTVPSSARKWCATQSGANRSRLPNP